MRHRIHVTADDIATATPKDSGHCAIADAIRRTLPDARGVTVDLQTIRFTDRAAGERYVWLTPVRAQDFLLAFDQAWTDRLGPFTVQLGAPVQVTPVKAATKAAAARTGRPATPGARTVERAGRSESGDPAGAVTVRGGAAPALAVLAHGRGRRREYGARFAGRPDAQIAAGVAYR